MTKRIIALLMSLFLVISAVALTGCGEDNEETSSEENASEETSDVSDGTIEDGETEEKEIVSINNLSAKDLFMLSCGAELDVDVDVDDDGKADEYSSIEDVFSDAGDIFAPVETNGSNLKGDIKFDLNKLVYDGNDFLNGEKASVNAGAIISEDLKSMQLDLGVSFLGDNPKLTGIVDMDGLYITNLLGVTDKAYGVKYEDLGIEMPSYSFGDIGSETIDMSQLFGKEAAKAVFGEDTMITVDELSELADEFTVLVISALEISVGKYCDDEFVKEVKDVTLNGKTSEDAVVVTFSITGDVMIELAKDFLSQLSDNEIYKLITYNAEPDLDSLKDELNDVKLTISNTIGVKPEIATIASDVVITIGEKSVGAKYSNFNDIADLTIAAMDENGNFDTVNGSLNCHYELAGETETFAINVSDGETEFTPFEISGSFDGKVHKGSLKFNALAGSSEIDENGNVIKEETSEVNLLAFDYSYESSDGFTALSVSNIVVDGKAYDVKVSFEYTYGDNSMEYAIAVVANVEDIEIDAKLSVSAEVTEEDLIKVPESYTNFMDLTNDDLGEIALNALGENPNIALFIYSFMESVQ